MAQAALLAVALTSLTACTSPPPPVPRVVFLLDRSSSSRGGLAESGCVPAFDRVTGYVAQQFGTVTVETVDANPLRDSGTPIDVNFHSLRSIADNSAYLNSMSQKLRDTAHAQLVELTQSPVGSKGTDLMSAFVLADRVVSRPPLDPNTPERRIVVVCSDMLASTPPLEFYRLNLNAREIGKLIRELESLHQIPDWRGVDVYVVGAGSTSGSSVSTEKIRQVQAFFEAYFQATGAHLVSYAATLPSFP